MNNKLQNPNRRIKFHVAIGLAIASISIVLLSYFLLPVQQVKAQTEPTVIPDKYGRSSQEFEPIRQLLLEANLPFDPEFVLNHKLNADSKDFVASKLNLIPEMQESRQLDSKIKGVQMADILYLPEKVQLTGTTVIVANKIVFEGTNPVIKGNYPILFYPVDTEGVLGTTLEVALKEQESMFLNASYSKSSRLKKFVPRLLKEGWTLTIDTSGQGYKEWLEKQQLKEKIFTKISYDNTNAGYSNILKLLLRNQDTSGGEGSPGDPISQGPTGGDGSPSHGIGGPPGTCGDETSVIGKDALEANPGMIGEDPLPVGNQGGRGGNARPQNVYLNSPSNQALYLSAKGGDGGLGGPGGKGGMGGRGADGGRGGAGANCRCDRGGAGNGGMGGTAGKGGKGGNGKKGGSGGDPGDGALIVVSVPHNNPFISADGDGGHGGRGGMGGDPGDPGTPGSPGAGGPGAFLSYICSTSPVTRNGADGLPNGNLGTGSFGEIGENRESVRGNAVAPQIERRPAPGGNGGTPTPTCYYNGNTGNNCQLGYGITNGGYCCPYSTPLLLDIDGDGFEMTSYYEGVPFDVNGDGAASQTSWTATDSDDAWLVLDRNGNNQIDGGLEMFGDASEQSVTSNPRNGFSSLAVFDTVSRGGNADGKINNNDAVFSRLRLWQDRNHNGISEPEELSRLPALDVAAIFLDYRESRRTDEHGNRFKYRAKVRDRNDARVGRWAWDVFLVISPPNGTNVSACALRD